MKHIKLYEDHAEDKDLTLSGIVRLYHYTSHDFGDMGILDPKLTIDKRSSWSMREYKTSDVPRVFYYTDLSKTETMVAKTNSHLYTGKIEGESILCLQNAVDQFNNNPKELEIKNPDAYNSIERFMKGYGKDFHILLNDASLYFKGVYYKTSAIPVVNLFVPLKVVKITY